MRNDNYDGDAAAVDPLPPRYSRSASNSKSQPRSTRVADAKPPCAKSPKDKEPRHWPPREMLYVKKYVELDDYVADFHSGRLANLTTAEKIERYGSSIAPIFVPLARGESIAEYEERFEEWLRKRKGLTLRGLQTDPNHHAERNEWYEFAHENAKGKEKHEPKSTSKKRGRSTERSEPPTKKAAHADSHEKLIAKKEPTKATRCTVAQPPANAPRTEVIAAYVACGCQRCLLKGIWHMARKVSEVETKINSKPKCLCGQSESVGASTKAQVIAEDDDRRSPPPSQPSVSKPRPVSASSSATRVAAAITKLVLSRPTPAQLVTLTSKTMVRKDPVEVEEDPVELQLAGEYDEINEQVIMNENVLEASAARLASTPVTDIQETTRLQDENLELRGFVQEEAENRIAALAMLVVYLWRLERSTLEAMINDSGASDVVHVQRMGHHKCGLLAKQIVEKREHAAKIKSELDTVMDSEDDDIKRLTKMAELGSTLTATESNLKTLRVQRKREFATLIHFDDHLRVLIKTLLNTAAL